MLEAPCNCDFVKSRPSQSQQDGSSRRDGCHQPEGLGSTHRTIGSKERMGCCALSPDPQMLCEEQACPTTPSPVALRSVSPVTSPRGPAGHIRDQVNQTGLRTTHPVQTRQLPAALYLPSPPPSPGPARVNSHSPHPVGKGEKGATIL